MYNYDQHTERLGNQKHNILAVQWNSLLQQMCVGINHGHHLVCGISFQ